MNIIEYADEAVARGAQCADCQTPLFAKDIRHKDHPDGWPVDGFAKKQWLYIRCPKRRCGYDTSFAKLGFPR